LCYGDSALNSNAQNWHNGSHFVRHIFNCPNFLFSPGVEYGEFVRLWRNQAHTIGKQDHP
jgi:hypothetical protein